MTCSWLGSIYPPELPPFAGEFEFSELPSIALRKLGLTLKGFIATSLVNC